MGKIFLAGGLFLSVSLFSFQIFAQTVLLSDVDDTIKSSHVLNKFEALQNTVQVKNHFYGMAEVYWAVQEAQPELKFVYLSAAPEKLMGKLHAKFLKENSFPEGELILREKLSDKDHKINAIRDVIAAYQPRKLILIGDNGERDPYIYAQAQSEFPNVEFEIYIHQVYSYRARKEIGVPKQAGQTLFVTSIDLARSMVAKNELPHESLEILASEMIPKLFTQNPKKKNGALFLPAWIDCRDFFGLENLKPSTWNLPASITERTPTEWLWAYDQILKSRCENGPVN